MEEQQGNFDFAVRVTDKVAAVVQPRLVTLVHKTQVGQAIYLWPAVYVQAGHPEATVPLPVKLGVITAGLCVTPHSCRQVHMFGKFVRKFTSFSVTRISGHSLAFSTLVATNSPGLKAYCIRRYDIASGPSGQWMASLTGRTEKGEQRQAIGRWTSDI
jgi:hypothetical protein